MTEIEKVKVELLDLIMQTDYLRATLKGYEDLKAQKLAELKESLKAAEAGKAGQAG